jgi:hypothetical protein
VKAMDEDLKMKEVKADNLTDKPNEMKVVKKNEKANTKDTLGKKERKKVKALREHILDEMTKINPEHEHFNVGARVKKKDNSLVGEITEWDGDTATIKTDEGKTVHVQGNVITKKDVPAPKEEAAQTGTTDEWAKPKAHMPESREVEEGYMGTPYGSSEEMAIDMVNKGITREDKMKSLKEKLVKAVKKEIAQVRDDKGAVVKLAANTADAQEFIQSQDPAVKSKLKVTGS